MANFDWSEGHIGPEKKLKERKGLFIEIGGPTFGGYEFIDFDDLDRKVYVSNIGPGCPRIKGGVISFEGTVDFQADGRKLPFRDNSLGAIFASCLGSFRHPSFMEFFDQKLPEKVAAEAFRTLEPGGLLLWQGCRELYVRFAESAGFKVLAHAGRYRSDNWCYGYFYCILQKPQE